MAAHNRNWSWEGIFNKGIQEWAKSIVNNFFFSLICLERNGRFTSSTNEWIHSNLTWFSNKKKKSVFFFPYRKNTQTILYTNIWMWNLMITRVHSSLRYSVSYETKVAGKKMSFKNNPATKWEQHCRCFLSCLGLEHGWSSWICSLSVLGGF